MRLKHRAGERLEGWETSTLETVTNQFVKANNVLRRHAYGGKGF
jgi:hypothetical protein